VNAALFRAQSGALSIAAAMRYCFFDAC